MTMHEAGKVLTSAIDGLKSSPMMLSLVLMQLLTIGAILYSSVDRQKANAAQFERLHTIIDKCIGK